eukprot:g80844.t1
MNCWEGKFAVWKSRANLMHKEGIFQEPQPRHCKNETTLRMEERDVTQEDEPPTVLGSLMLGLFIYLRHLDLRNCCNLTDAGIADQSSISDCRTLTRM